MKNTLMIPLVFAGRLLVWLVIIGVFSVFTSGPVLSVLMAGKFTHFFVSLLHTTLQYAPLAVMFALLNVFFFVMRHRTVFVLSFPLVVLIAAASVMYVVPGSYFLSHRLDSTFEIVKSEVNTASSGVYASNVIRDGPGMTKRVWFEVSPGGDEVKPAVLVNSNVAPDLQVLTVYESALYSAETHSLTYGEHIIIPEAGGLDPLVAVQVDRPAFIDRVYSSVDPVLSVFMSAIQADKFLYLVVVGSFFTAICALWFLCYATSWRLLNVMIVITAFGSLFFLYPLTVSGPLNAFVSGLSLFVGKQDLVSSAIYAGLSVLIMIAGIPLVLVRTFAAKGVSYE